ncbi:MAG: ROK family protein [Spirochaetales bacterium]
MRPLFGAIEAGGTKFVCAVGTGPDDLHDEVRFATTTPTETLGRALDYFRQAQVKHGKLAALGIGSFGPLDLDQKSPTWGNITATPKPLWSHTKFATLFRDEFKVPVGFDTDVNGAALAEARWGAGQGLSDLIYITVGTGLGGGGISGGKLVHGLVHPEMGHLLLSKVAGDTFEGLCPFHGHCVEGYTSGPALEKRWGRKAYDLPPDHEAWDLEATYLAQAVLAYLATLSPQRIILGGGVMEQKQMFPKLRAEVLRLNNGYIQSPALTPEGLGGFLVPPGLGNRAGVLGAVALAESALA